MLKSDLVFNLRLVDHWSIASSNCGMWPLISVWQGHDIKDKLRWVSDRLCIDRWYMGRDYEFITKIDYFSAALLPFNFACKNSPFREYRIRENIWYSELTDSILSTSGQICVSTRSFYFGSQLEWLVQICYLQCREQTFKIRTAYAVKQGSLKH